LIKVGEPGAGPEIEIGPLTSKGHFDRVVGYLERAQRDGIRAAVGGSALEGPGYLVAPTVLVSVPDGAECSREEIFGPVVTIETFASKEEAIAGQTTCRSAWPRPSGPKTPGEAMTWHPRSMPVPSG
jgi:aminobutyraldehyde dehydrogenase